MATTAGELKIPEPYLGKIMQELVRKNIITSVKGPGGGFFIDATQQHIPVMSIVAAIDGMHGFESCALGMEDCSGDNPCPLHYEFKEFRDRLKEVFETTTIDQLSEGVVNGLSVLSR